MESSPVLRMPTLHYLFLPLITEIEPPDDIQQFTITCSDFKQLYDALSEVNIGNMVAEGNINQSTLDGVETIFNNHAGNCSQLDEYEFE